MCAIIKSMRLKHANSKELLQKIENLYNTSFPKEEKKPFTLIVEKQKRKKVDILSIEYKKNFCGLMILALNKDNILLDYFAIDTLFQSQGLGSKAIKLLYKKYENKNIIIEIESTKINSNNLIQREKRKKFYLKNNFKSLNFNVNLFNVEMEMLSNNTNITYKEYIEIYKNIYGNEIIKNISLITNNSSLKDN